MPETPPLGFCGKFRRQVRHIKKSISRTFRRIAITLPSLSDFGRRKKRIRTVTIGIGTTESLTRLGRRTSRVLPFLPPSTNTDVSCQTTPECLMISGSRRTLSVSSQPILNIEESRNFVVATDSAPGIPQPQQHRQRNTTRRSSILKIRAVPRRVSAEFVPLHMRDTVSSRLKSRRTDRPPRFSRTSVNPSRISSSSSNNLSQSSGFSRSRSRSGSRRSISRSRSRDASTVVIDVLPIVPDSESHLVGRTGQTELETYGRETHILTASTSQALPVLPVRTRRVTIVAPVRPSPADMAVGQSRAVRHYNYLYTPRDIEQRRYYDRTTHFRRRN